MERVGFFTGPGRDAVQVPVLRIGLFGAATGRKDEHKNVPVPQLTPKLALAAAKGELQLLDGRRYITHTGLLRIAHRRRCRGIQTPWKRNCLTL